MVGWAKRGPTGVLGTNKRYADHTVARLIEDKDAGGSPEPAHDGIDELLAQRRPDPVDVAGWRAIDAHEARRGPRRGAARVKLASREELLVAARESGWTGVPPDAGRNRPGHPGVIRSTLRKRAVP